MLTECGFQLAVLDEAIARVVEHTEELVNVLARCIVAESSNGLTELLLINRAVAIVVPVTEQINELD